MVLQILAEHMGKTIQLSRIMLDAIIKVWSILCLGCLIESLNIDAPALKEKCMKNISAGFSLLDPAVEANGSFSSKWNLRINASVSK